MKRKVFRAPSQHVGGRIDRIERDDRRWKKERVIGCPSMCQQYRKEKKMPVRKSSCVLNAVLGDDVENKWKCGKGGMLGGKRQRQSLAKRRPQILSSERVIKKSKRDAKKLKCVRRGNQSRGPSPLPQEETMQWGTNDAEIKFSFGRYYSGKAMLLYCRNLKYETLRR